MIRKSFILSLSFLGLSHPALAQVATSNITVTNNPRLEELISFDRQKINLTGRGVRVCVIDSGQQLAIAERKGLVQAPYNALDGSACVTDNDGHGTAAAGIIHQMAPEAVLIPVKAFNDGIGNHFAVSDGIQHCLDNKADIISISANIHSELKYRIPEMIGSDFNNALIVVAAGNSNYDLEKEDSLTNNVLVIGATNLDFPLKGTIYTVYGTGVDLYAPAGGIDDGIETWTPQNTIRKFNGTSAATPVVAGAMALLKQQNANMPPHHLKKMALKKMCPFQPGKVTNDTALFLNMDVLLTPMKRCQ